MWLYTNDSHGPKMWFVKGQDFKVFNYVGHEKKSYKGQVHIGCIGLWV